MDARPLAEPVGEAAEEDGAGQEPPGLPQPRLVWQLLQAGQEALRHERHRDAVEEDLRHVPGARQRPRVEGVGKGGDGEDAQEHARPNGAGPGAGAGKLGRALGRP